MSTCIPYGIGIWHMIGPPNWGLSGGALPVWDTVDPAKPAEGAIKDPRWQGSASQSFGSGSTEEAAFRAVWAQDGAGKRFLYFSWHVKFDADPASTTDRVFVVIAPSAGGGSPLILDIQPFNDAADHLTGVVPFSIAAGRRSASGTSAPIMNPPNWLNDTKAWRTGTAALQGEWAIHMRVPIDPAATDVDGNSGLRLTTSFNMWYEFRIKEATSASGNPVSGGVLRLNLPNGVSLTGGGTVFPDPNAAGQGENYTYGAVIANPHDVSCVGGTGIDIGETDIGTDNVPTSDIQPVASNTFWAKPTNNTTAAVGPNVINANFRLANWGSSYGGATWSTIRSNVTNSNTINVGQKADATNDIRFTMSNVASAYSNVASQPHQCMLVELSGGGLHFVRSSVVRNMDFVVNSKVSRTAQINLRGLAPIGGRPRDVYLAVETINMPERADLDFGTFGPLNMSTLKRSEDRRDQNAGDRVAAARAMIERSYARDRQATPEHRLGLMVDALRDGGATTDDLDLIFPTYRVHVYYDSGERWTVGGVTYPLLSLLPSFGYYCYHEGRLTGFNHQLRGATRVAKNFYVLRVPNNGSVNVTTIVHGVSPGEESLIEQDEPIRDWPKTDEGGGCFNPLNLLRKLFGS